MNRMVVGMISAAALVASSLVGAAVVAGPIASAADRPCVVTFTPDPVASGAPFSVTVTGFDPNEIVAVVGTVGGVPTIDFTTKVNASGAFITSDAVAGPRVIVFTFTGQSSSITCAGTLTVLATTTTTSTTSPPATLAPTTTAPATKAAAVTAKPAFTG